MTSANTVQEDWAFGDDDGGINANTFDTVNAPRTAQAADSTFRLRFVVQQTGKAQKNQVYTLYSSYEGAGYVAVTTTSTYVQLTNDSQSIADHATTTQVIGDGTYITGDSQGWDDGQTDNHTGLNDEVAGSEGEIEFCLTIPSGAVNDGDTLDFEARYSDGSQFNSYLGTRPRATAASAGHSPITMDYDTFALTGQTVDFLAARTITASYDTFSLTGQTVGLAKGYALAIEYGTFALTGQVINFAAHRVITAAQGALALSGQVIGLYTNRQLTIAQGAYSLTGQAVGLYANRQLQMAQGAFALTGQDVGLVYSGAGAHDPLVAVYGTFALTGQDVGLYVNRQLSIGQGAFTLTGQTVNFWIGYALAVAQGSFTFSGQTIDFARSYEIGITQGAFILSGQVVGLDYSGTGGQRPIKVTNASDIFAKIFAGLIVTE